MACVADSAICNSQMRHCRSQNVDELACHTSPGSNVASAICRFGRFCNLQIPSFVPVILSLLGKYPLPNGVCKLQIPFRRFLEQHLGTSLLLPYLLLRRLGPKGHSRAGRCGRQKQSFALR